MGSFLPISIKDARFATNRRNMNRPSVTEMLSVWERGYELSFLRKTLLLLELTFPGPEKEKVAELNIAERDARLFQLRKWMFGSQFRNVADCPKCADRMEWEMDMSHLPSLPRNYTGTNEEYELDVDQYKIRYRLPNSQDRDSMGTSMILCFTSNILCDTY